MKHWQPWTTEDDALRLTDWPDHGPGHVLVEVDVFAPHEGPVCNCTGVPLWTLPGYDALPLDERYIASPVARNTMTGVTRQAATFGDLCHDLFARIDSRPETHYTLRTRHPERVRGCWPERCGTDCECECHEVPPPNRHIPCQAGGCWERPNVTLQIGPIHTQADADRLLPAGLECSDLMGSVEVYCQPTERIQFPLPCRESVFWAGISRIVVSGGDKPMHPDWVRCLRDQATAAGIEFVFESWGEWLPVGHGLQPPEWCNERRYESVTVAGSTMLRVGREHSGNTLDGRTWPRTEVAV